MQESAPERVCFFVSMGQCSVHSEPPEHNMESHSRPKLFAHIGTPTAAVKSGTYLLCMGVMISEWIGGAGIGADDM